MHFNGILHLTLIDALVLNFIADIFQWNVIFVQDIISVYLLFIFVSNLFEFGLFDPTLMSLTRK